MPNKESALRHVPKQLRSQRRVDRILQSAEAVFAEVGYDHATTNAVAVRAGISIGSLYQFFESKEAILEAMGQRYLSVTQAALQEHLGQSDVADLRQLILNVLETMLRLQEQRPFFLQCLGTRHAYEALAGSVSEVRAGVVTLVRGILEKLDESADPRALDRRAQIVVGIFSSLLPLALASKGKERQAIIQETVDVLEGYMASEPRVAARV